jgi:hypothetical protein
MDSSILKKGIFCLLVTKEYSFSSRANLIRKKNRARSKSPSTHDSFAELDPCNDERRHSSCTNDKEEPTLSDN